MTAHPAQPHHANHAARAHAHARAVAAGGGWCFNEEQCAERSTTVLGTTKILPEFLNETWSKTSGPLHPNTTLNPTFANYHRVLLWYCDGASFAGSVSHPVTNTSTKTGKTTTMWFRGRAVLVSLLAKLKQDYGLDKVWPTAISPLVPPPRPALPLRAPSEPPPRPQCQSPVLTAVLPL